MLSVEARRIGNAYGAGAMDWGAEICGDWALGARVAIN